MKKIYCTVILANDPLEIPLANKVTLVVNDNETEIEACSNFARDIAMEKSLEEKDVLIQWYDNYNDNMSVYNFGIPYSESFIKEYKKAIEWWFNLSEEEQLYYSDGKELYDLVSEDSLIEYWNYFVSEIFNLSDKSRIEDPNLIYFLNYQRMMQ